MRRAAMGREPEKLVPPGELILYLRPPSDGGVSEVKLKVEPFMIALGTPVHGTVVGIVREERADEG